MLVVLISHWQLETVTGLAGSDDGDYCKGVRRSSVDSLVSIDAPILR